MKRILPSNIMTSREAATHLGTSMQYLANLRWQGKGPQYVRIDRDQRRVYYRLSDLDRYARCQVNR